MVSEFELLARVCRAERARKTESIGNEQRKSAAATSPPPPTAVCFRGGGGESLDEAAAAVVVVVACPRGYGGHLSQGITAYATQQTNKQAKRRQNVRRQKHIMSEKNKRHTRAKGIIVTGDR